MGYQKRYQYRDKWINNWFEISEEDLLKNFEYWDIAINDKEVKDILERLKSGEPLTSFDVQWRYKK
jgi:hypothetical protein